MYFPITSPNTSKELSQKISPKLPNTTGKIRDLSRKPLPIPDTSNDDSSFPQIPITSPKTTIKQQETSPIESSIESPMDSPIDSPIDSSITSPTISPMPLRHDVDSSDEEDAEITDLVEEVKSPQLTTNQIKSPTAQIKSPNTQIKSPNTQIKSPNTSQIKSPNTAQVKSPNTAQVKSPNTAQIKTPNTTQIKSPKTTQVKSPNTAQIKSPNTAQVKSPKTTTTQIKSPKIIRSPIHNDVKTPKITKQINKPTTKILPPHSTDVETQKKPTQQDIKKSGTRPRAPRARKTANITQPAPKINMPDYASMSEAEQARYVANFNVKFGMLRQTYPEFNIPHFDETVPLEVKHQHYQRYVEQIHIDNSVGNYKVYLLLFLGIIELVGVQVLGFDMGGFTIDQLTMLTKYDNLLIELGEKSKSSIGSDWPVEARLILLALFNALIFLVVRLFASYLGTGMGDVFKQIVNSFLTKKDPNEHIQKAAGNVTDPQKGEIPEMPAKSGGFDFNTIINGLGGLFGGGKKNTAKASQGPTFRE